MVPTTINGRWDLLLPEHRADRPQWGDWRDEHTGEAKFGWETARLAAMRELIDGDDDCVWDVGAEEGDLSALYALWGARVVLAEPNPKVWPNIRAIFDANALSGHVRGWHVGFIGDEERPPTPEWISEHVLPVEDGWPACAFGPVIGDHGFLVLPERPDVPVRSIDSLTAQLGAPTPSVITIDVEGAELTVLRGAERTLRVDRPALFVSVHLDRPWIEEKYPGDTGERLDEYLGGLGYAGETLAIDHEEHRVYRHPAGR